MIFILYVCIGKPLH